VSGLCLPCKISLNYLMHRDLPWAVSYDYYFHITVSVLDIVFTLHILKSFWKSTLIRYLKYSNTHRPICRYIGAHR